MYNNGIYIGYIYKVTNMINGKIYIGQTRQTIKRRWSQHITNSKLEQSHSLLDTAIKKYGPDKFSIECVKEISSNTKHELIQTLNQEEKYNIIKYSSSCEFGNYNITNGGEKTSPTCLIPVDQYDKTGRYIKTYSGMIDVAYDLCISENCFANISACCNGRKLTAYGYVWRYKGDAFDKYRTTKKSAKMHFPIDIYDMNGNLIYTYDDCQDAVDDKIIYNIQAVQNACKGKRSSYRGMVIRYQGEAFDKYPVSHRYAKTNRFNGYDKNTNELKFFNMTTKGILMSVNNASDTSYKFHTIVNKISNCVNHKLNTWHNCKWFYADDPNQPDSTKIITK